MSEKTNPSDRDQPGDSTTRPPPVTEAELHQIRKGIEDTNRQRDAKNASTLLNLLANVPMQATFGDIDKVANETLEVRNWLEEMAESQP